MYTYTPYQPHAAPYAMSYAFPNTGQPVPAVAVQVSGAPGGNVANAGGSGNDASIGAVSPSSFAPSTAGALCCDLVQSHRPIVTHWETHVNSFMAWLTGHGKTTASLTLPEGCELVLRLTTTITYGRECGVMEYAAVQTRSGVPGRPAQYTFASVVLNVGSNAGFVDRCAFKNYTCPVHKLNFRLDMYRATHG